MKRSIMIAFVCASAAAALPCDGARAANAWGGWYCMSDREGRNDCSFTTLAQCQASASGTGAGCYARPQALPGAPALQPAPSQGRRAARAGR